MDEGWRDEGRDGDEVEASGAYAAAEEHYPEPPARHYEEPRADPLRADLGPTELPRIAPGTPSRMPPTDPAGHPHSPAPPVQPVPPMAPPGSAAAVPAPRRPTSAPHSPGPMGENVYRSKRPAALIGFGAVAIALEIPALLLLFSATTADPISVTGVVAAVCLVCALPLAAAGLYAVATGAVRAAGPNSLQAWLRPPVSYLTVALVLFLAAGLAA